MLLTPNVKHILPRAIWLKNKNGCLKCDVCTIILFRFQYRETGICILNISVLILISNASDGLGIGVYTSLRIDTIQHPQNGPCYFPAPTYKQLARLFYCTSKQYLFSYIC